MPDPHAELEKWFLEVAGRRLEATRLRPRRGEPGMHDSSMGGPLLWPALDAWPECSSLRHLFRSPTEYDHWLSFLMVPLLQLFHRDAPWLDFPEDADLLQILWCPYEHGPFWRPLPMVVWWDSTSFEEIAEPPEERFGKYVLEPCVLAPERLMTYPSPMGLDLPASRLDAFEAATAVDYYSAAQPAGHRIGGHPGWWNDPMPQWCESCGEEMGLLFEHSDGEEHGGDVTRGPTGVTFPGGFYIFECRRCPDRPYTYYADA